MSAEQTEQQIPVTAGLVAAALCGEETDAAFSPRRFARVAA